MDESFVAGFERIVADAAATLLGMDDSVASRRPAPNKWSPKEIIGHLIDSATHNQTRFVLAQLQDDLIFPGYDQDAWVHAQHYHEREWADLVETWRAYNSQVAAVMRATPTEEARRPRARHNLGDIAFQTLAPGVDATLAFLMRDYVVHLQHHLRQILR